MNNALLKLFQEGKPSVGTFTQLASPIAVECLSYSGLDYVLIDTEHTSYSIERASDLVAAARGAGITPVVRINDITRCNVLRPLDAGAAALVIPGVETVEQVRELVSWAKYTPVGNRGYCPPREGGFGYADWAKNGYPAYAEYANRNTMLIPQCETLGCLEHIEEIAAMEGVDGIFVGPFDLSIAMGYPLQFDHPEVVAAIDRILRVCKENGKLTMIFAADSSAAAARLAQGFDSVTVGLDTAALTEAFRSVALACKG